jgi:hypothetical protein
MGQVVKTLSIKPNGTDEFYSSHYSLEPGKLWSKTERIMLELLDMVESKYPDLELSDVRQKFAGVRRKHAQSPFVSK